jgi:exodeoxyribonuclease VII large subunit
MTSALSGTIQRRGQRLRDLSRALPRLDTLVEGPRQRLDYLSDRLPAALRTAAAKKRLQVSEAALRPGVLSRRLVEDRRRLDTLTDRLVPALQRRTRDGQQILEQTARGLRPAQLEMRVQRQSEQFSAVSRRLSDRASRQQQERLSRLEALDRLRETLGYVETLKRGYAVVRGDGVVVTGKAVAENATALEIEFADGRLAIGK